MMATPCFSMPNLRLAQSRPFLRILTSRSLSALPVDEALALSLQGVPSISSKILLCLISIPVES